MRYNLKNRPKCRTCPQFIIDKNEESDHFGIPDRCEDTNKQSWEENPEQDFFLCNPIQDWLEGFDKELRRELKILQESGESNATAEWLIEEILGEAQE